MATTETTAPASRVGLLINRNFALLWSSQAISIIGDTIYDTTLVLWIAFTLARGQAWAPLAVSGVLAAQSIPMLLIRPLAGVFIDRWDKRRTMIVMDILRTLIIGALLLTTGIVPLPFWADGHLPLLWQLGAIYLVVFLATTCAQFFNPARLALTGDIVAEPLLGRAFGFDYSTENLAFIVGPTLAALLFLWGVQWALAINALSFVVSFVMVAAIHPPAAARSVAPGERGNVGRELGEGMRFFVGNRVLRTLTITICIAMLGFGALKVLNVFFVQDNLHSGTVIYAWLMAASSIGAVAGALVAAGPVKWLGAGRAFGLATMIIGVCLLIFSRMALVVPALALVFVAGLMEAVVNVATGPLLLTATPREMVGRISSLLNPLVTLVSLLSVMLAGWLDSNLLQGLHVVVGAFTFGPVDTIYTFAGLIAILAGLYALRNLHGMKQQAESE